MRTAVEIPEVELDRQQKKTLGVTETKANRMKPTENGDRCLLWQAMRGSKNRAEPPACLGLVKRSSRNEASEAGNWLAPKSKSDVVSVSKPDMLLNHLGAPDICLSI
jgi:hypothetical protein